MKPKFMVIRIHPLYGTQTVCETEADRDRFIAESKKIHPQIPVYWTVVTEAA